MQSVLSLSKATIKKCQDYYAGHLKATAPTGALFQAQTNETTITAYHSGKVLFQGANASQEASRWANQQLDLNKKGEKRVKVRPQHDQPGQNLPAGFQNWSVIGSDEVGAGAYFGPLTTAAVYVPKDQNAWVKSLGIADSKTLTDEKIKNLAPKIIDRLPHHVVNLMPDKYNQLQQSKQNVVAMKALSHNFVLATVLKKISPAKPDGFLIDQFVAPNSYFHYLKKNQQKPIVADQVYFSTKGERYHLAVAAASILARYVELISMAELSQEAGIHLPIGAGKEADRVASQLIKEGKDLSHFAKVHFANTQKAQKLAQE
ncbi:ribonuclease HIII [Fructobacillus americanaquae]|uniref:Ribonuclease HIII n=1 Tax=Fructobacillus americanaquae TaxID=2940302 RepID=A0ABY5C126_9LACO|nr:ribonuclease HIII [Fructobacillus americanaquae]USS92467.1 ribonuclease HIII [Fructobacillus americanaquae]